MSLLQLHSRPSRSRIKGPFGRGYSRKGARAVPAGGTIHSAPGRLGHRTCRHYDRRARCIAVSAILSGGNAFASCFARSAAWAEPWHSFAWQAPRRSAERRARPKRFRMATSEGVARVRARKHQQAVTPVDVAWTIIRCACRRSASLLCWGGNMVVAV
jgi:hypothetical protein